MKSIKKSTQQYIAIVIIAVITYIIDYHILTNPKSPQWLVWLCIVSLIVELPILEKYRPNEI